VELGLAAVPTNWIAGFSGVNQNGPAPDLAPHRFKAWRDGANRNLQVDTVLSSTADAASTVTAITEGRLGGYANPSNAFPGDSNVAFVLLCSAKPTAAEENALDSWAQAYYALPSQRPPLPAAAVDYWHSELQCTPAAWIGQMGARSLPGTGSLPAVGTDPGFFKDRIVGKSTAGGTFWRGTGFTGLPVSGDKPWVMLVGRLRNTTFAGVDEIMCGAGRDGVDDDARLAAQLTGGVWRATFSGAPNIAVSTAPIDAAVHNFKAWRDGTLVNLQVDATLYTAADGGGLSASVNAVGIGGPCNTPSFGADLNAAFFLICKTKPSAAEISALDAWARAYWGTL
jgi:hypothetical protein